MATIVAIPAAATLLEQVDPRPRDHVAADVTRLRAAIDGLDFTGADVAVLVVQGASGVTVAGQAGLAGYGYPDVQLPLTPAVATAGALAGHLGVDVSVADELDAEFGVLALQVAARVDVPVVAVSVDADLPMIGAVVQVLREVASTSRLAVVVAGDLAATLTTRAPGYLVDGAQDWDRRALEAIEALDVDRLGALGPEESRQVVAHGWAPLLVATQLARDQGAAPPEVVHAAPHGVGYVVARFAR